MYFKSNSVEISKDSDIIYIVGHVMRAVNYFRHVEIRFRERKTHKKLRSLVIWIVALDTVHYHTFKMAGNINKANTHVWN